MKKKSKMTILISIVAVLFIIILIYKATSPEKAVGEYDKKIGSKIFQENKAYDIGLAESGKPAFKDANKAFKQAKIDFAGGFDLIKDEFNLNKLNKFYWKPYKTYGWQVTTEDDELKKQCLDISAFFDIYENSFGIE